MSGIRFKATLHTSTRGRPLRGHVSTTGTGIRFVPSSRLHDSIPLEPDQVSRGGSVSSRKSALLVQLDPGAEPVELQLRDNHADTLMRLLNGGPVHHRLRHFWRKPISHLLWIVPALALAGYLFTLPLGIVPGSILMAIVFEFVAHRMRAARNPRREIDPVMVGFAAFATTFVAMGTVSLVADGTQAILLSESTATANAEVTTVTVNKGRGENITSYNVEVRFEAQGRPVTKWLESEDEARVGDTVRVRYAPELPAAADLDDGGNRYAWRAIGLGAIGVAAAVVRVLLLRDRSAAARRRLRR